MKKLSVFIFLFFLFNACRQSQTSELNVAAEKKTVSSTDMDFSMQSRDGDHADSFDYYSSSDVVKIRPGKRPLMGRKQLRASYSSSGNAKRKSSVSWELTKVDIAQSDDMGYTIGNWKYTTQTMDGRDTTIYGNYVAVWKKQSDGSWKYIIDDENTPLPPKNTAS